MSKPVVMFVEKTRRIQQAISSLAWMVAFKVGSNIDDDHREL
jgi:hypothetical protein